MAELYLKDKTYTPVRLRLRRWLEFEATQKKITKAVEDKNVEEYARQLYVLISAALDIQIEDIFDAPWYEITEAYAVITNLNKIKEIPLISKQIKPDKEMPWEYEGREWFWWVHTFAKNYGWNQTEVGELDVDEALALLQEILVSDQFDREWQWSMTEIAYPYNETTKKSHFNPLPRPLWMEGTTVNVLSKKVKIPKTMLPIGRIVGEDGNERLVN